MLQRILRFSIYHPGLIIVLTLMAAAMGAYSLSHLPIDAVPDITNNQVHINTVAPALSPLEIEKQVTFLVETSLAGIPGLEYSRSLSRNGFSQVTAIFEDEVDIYFARNQVNERLGQVRGSLPPGAEPAMGPIATGLGEIYMWTVGFDQPGSPAAGVVDGQPGWQSDGSYLTAEGERLHSEIERAAYLRTVQDWIIRPQLKSVPEVAGVDSIGGYLKQYQVRPDPQKLVGFGLTFREVIEALERNNVSTGAGFVEHLGEAYVVRAAGRIETLDELSAIVIATRDGVPIHVHDVAEVGIGGELRTGSASEDGSEVVVGTALMLIGANSRTVSSAVDAKMREVSKSLPPGIHVKTVLNRTKLVDATVKTVEKNLFEGAILVIAVLFLLLGNIRAAILTALAIPLSMLLTATGMVQSRISGNLMSLGAIDFGLIVDGAVIIVENSLRLLAEKQRALGRRLATGERREAVLEASRQVLGPAVFGACIIITVYLPILALTGIEGKMFRPMAMTVIFALVAAFVLSLTFVPAMVALVIRGRVAEKENVLVRAAKRGYKPVLEMAVRRRWWVVGGAAAAFAGALLLFNHLGQEFVPTLDEKDIAMHAMRIPSTGIAQSTEMQLEVERIVSAFPEVAFVFSKTGTAEMASDPMPPNVSDTFIILKPHEEWPDPELPKSTLQQRLEAAVQEAAGHNYEFTQPIQMRFNELIAGVRGDVAIKVYGDDFPAMERTAQTIAGVLRRIPGAADIRVEQTTGLPTMNIRIDRAAISRIGLGVADVQDVVAAAIGGRQAGLVFEGDRRFDLVVRLPDAVREDVHRLEELPIPLAPGAEASAETVSPVSAGHIRIGPGFVPLGAVASIEVSEGPNQVSRENGKRRIVVQCNVRGRDLGSFAAEAQTRVNALDLPVGSWLEWGGQFENLVAARKRLSVVVPACFVLIFLLLYTTFQSARQALLVFSGVPLGLTGGIVALWLRDMPFSISAAVGFIALSGVAVLNGLVLVTFINQLRARGGELSEAIIHGGLVRLRPVLMTAMVASLGFVPMAMATGTGAEVQKPLATVVIGGLISSTLLTLLVLPALYRIFEGGRAKRVQAGGAPNPMATVPHDSL
ncbi:MAG: CusA/CzcA family heavy metal efflux RND transporter [Planctomycetota bacterium]|nr:MAG: CusA/CzcA family heavy metal efflux RND transporter [Planctomycetota bacterium]